MSVSLKHMERVLAFQQELEREALKRILVNARWSNEAKDFLVAEDLINSAAEVLLKGDPQPDTPKPRICRTKQERSK